MSESLETAIIGAGVVGCAVARELATRGRQVFVFERNPGVTSGENQSSRNSGVIHSGVYYDRPTRPLKAELCAPGARLLAEFCGREKVPHLVCGKLLLATSQSEIQTLRMYLERARQNGVRAELLDAAQVRELEPAALAVAALHLPDAGIVEPTALVSRLRLRAEEAGAVFMTGTEVRGLRLDAEGVRVDLRYRDGAGDQCLAAGLVNCAGLHADQVLAMLLPQAGLRVDPMRGEFMCFQAGARPELEFRGLNLYPTPHRVNLPGGTYWTVGVHLTPTLEVDRDGGWALSRTVTVGPLNSAARDKDDLGLPRHEASEFLELVRPFYPGLRLEDLRPHQVGLQARLAGHQDWLLQRVGPSLHLLGIDSPGLTACLAIAARVGALLESGRP